jgi:signal transduction histidine kinase
MSSVEQENAKYLRFLRIFGIVGTFMGLIVGHFFLTIPGAKEILIDRYALALICFCCLFASFFIKRARENAYYVLLVPVFAVITNIAFIVPYNNTTPIYAVAGLIGYTIFTLVMKTATHLRIYSIYSFVSLIVFTVIMISRGESQNLYAIGFMLLIGALVHLWSEARQHTQELIERTVEERTKSLREEQAKLQAAISAITGLLVIIDDKGNVILSNHKYVEVLGVNYEPRNIVELQQVFGGSYDVSGAYSISLRQSRVVDHSSVEYKDKFLRVLFAPVYDTANVQAGGGQKIIGVLILMGDVTEEELLDRARDEFFAIASHELRTPLTAIQGNLALVLDYIDSGRLEHAKVLDMLQDAMKSSKRLIRLVHDFLDLSRLEQGRVKFEEQKVDMGQLAKEVLLEYDQELKSKNMTSELINNAPNIYVFADEDRVKQVVVNLVSNAVRYSKKGKVTITLQQKENMLEMLVADAGVGIAQENQKYLFRKFQQAGKNVLSRDTSQGTGLGLYISRLVIRAMGGDVYLVKSEENVGSTFGFTLPIKK